MFPSSMHRRAGLLSGLLITILSLSPPAVSNAQQSAPSCQPAGAIARIPELPEGSGLAASRRTPGRFWAHNDSSGPVLVALDSGGRVVGRLQLSGADVEDWEAIAVGPCPAGSCIYVADIGDNDAERDHITIYRVPEPAEASGSAEVRDVFGATYPDGPRNAEALLLTPEGRLYIVTKGDKGPVALYRFPSELTGTTLRLERVGEPRQPQSRSATDRITDGAVSPDGRWVALRTKQTLTFYRAADLLAGNWRETARVALAPLGEPQGEGVSFGADKADNTVYLLSEGGGKKQPGVFGRLTCSRGT